MDGCGLKKICFIYRYYHTYLHKYRFSQFSKLEVIEEHPLIATSYYGYFLQLHQ